jgi:protein gp37
MAEKTGISWTDHTFNVVWGCTKVSPACTRCYAETLSLRFGFDVWGPHKPRRTFGQAHWNEPRRWNRAAQKAGTSARVFCSSMCDVFEDHPTVIQELQKLWPLIKATPHLEWQLLTKRPERILASLPSDYSLAAYPNIWLGTTIENNDYIGRADFLRAVPCRVRFISYEPALGSLDQLSLSGLHWLIFGGESGAGFRRHDPQWARDIRARCEAQGVAFFYKQGSSLRSGQDDTLDGQVVKTFPRVPLPLLGE